MAHVRRKLATTKKHEDVILVLLEREPKNPFIKFTLNESDWLKHRETVLDIWIANNAGTRPLYWWKFEAPEARRKQLKGTKEIVYHALDHNSNYRYNKGISELWWYGENVKHIPVFESQAAYLKRHKLFMDGEEERLNENHYKAESLGEVKRAKKGTC